MKAAIASIVKAGGLFTCSLLLLLGGCSGGSSTNSTLPIAPAPSPVGAQTPKPGSSPTAVPSVKPSAIPNPVVSPTPTPAPTPIGFNDYVTFGYDNQRDSFNPNSTAITSASVAAMHLVWQSALSGDFDTQSQPILATEIPGHAGVLFVAGGSGRIYAFDALTGKSIWTTTTGQAHYACPDSTGALNKLSSYGIGGTLAYDAASKSLYAVGNYSPGTTAYASNILYHIDAASGTVIGQVNFAPAQVSAGEFNNHAHTSVALSNGTAYVGIGSACDVSSWRGSVVAISVPSMAVIGTFLTLWDPNNTRGQGAQPWSGGGVWGWGGVSLDAAGNVFTGVGNADNGTNVGTIQAPFTSAPQEYSGYAETLLELAPNLSQAIASHHPIGLGFYNSSTGAIDLDVQGTPVFFTPTGCGPMVALQAKSGELSVYNEGTLSNGPAAQYVMGPANGDDSYLGNPAYSPATGLLYADISSSTAPTLLPPGLIAINPGCGNPSTAWHAQFGTDSSQASVSRPVPAASAGGVVFAGSTNGNGGSVWVLDASTGAVLNNGTPLLQTSGYLRMPPTLDGKWVFIIDNSGDLYGLTIDPSYAAIRARYRAPSPLQQTRYAGWRN